MFIKSENSYQWKPQQKNRNGKSERKSWSICGSGEVGTGAWISWGWQIGGCYTTVGATRGRWRALLESGRPERELLARHLWPHCGTTAPPSLRAPPHHRRPWRALDTRRTRPAAPQYTLSRRPANRSAAVRVLLGRCRRCCCYWAAATAAGAPPYTCRRRDQLENT